MGTGDASYSYETHDHISLSGGKMQVIHKSKSVNNAKEEERTEEEWLKTEVLEFSPWLWFVRTDTWQKAA